MTPTRTVTPVRTPRATEKEARENQVTLRKRFTGMLEVRETLAMDAISALRRGEHTALKLDAEKWFADTFPGASRSFYFRVKLPAEELKHMPVKELADLSEGNRYELARAAKALGAGKKVRALAEKAKTAVNADFRTEVNKEIYSPEQHRENWVWVKIRMLEGDAEEWRKAVERLAQSLSLDLKQDGAEAQCLKALALIIQDTPIEELRKAAHLEG